MAHFLLFHFLPLSPTGIFFPPLKNELHFLPVMISTINRQSLITVYTFRTHRERERESVSVTWSFPDTRNSFGEPIKTRGCSTPLKGSSSSSTLDVGGRKGQKGQALLLYSKKAAFEDFPMICWYPSDPFSFCCCYCRSISQLKSHGTATTKRA